MAGIKKTLSLAPSRDDKSKRRKQTQQRIQEALTLAQPLARDTYEPPVGPTGSGPIGAIAASGDQASNDLLDATFNQALNKLIAASGGKISITSGKRSTQRQKELWEAALKKYGDPEIADNWVAPPGRSKHEFGLAADLRYADEATKRWAHEVAKQYGLYFPLSNEDWHIEPLGSRG